VTHTELELRGRLCTGKGIHKEKRKKLGRNNSRKKPAPQKRGRGEDLVNIGAMPEGGGAKGDGVLRG